MTASFVPEGEVRWTLDWQGESRGAVIGDAGAAIGTYFGIANSRREAETRRNGLHREQRRAPASLRPDGKPKEFAT